MADANKNINLTRGNKGGKNQTNGDMNKALTLEDFNMTMSGFQSQLNALQISVNGLAALVSKVEDVERKQTETKEKIVDLQDRLIKSEQYSRRNHLEISNVLYCDGEDLTAFVIKLSAFIGVNIQHTDIASVHRLPVRDKRPPNPSRMSEDLFNTPAISSRPIIVEFVNRQVRDKIFANRYSKEIYNKHFFSDVKEPDDKRIYVYASLSPFLKKLRWETNQVKKEFKFHKLKYNNCKFILLQTADGPSHIISNLEDVENLRLKLKATPVYKC